MQGDVCMPRMRVFPVFAEFLVFLELKGTFLEMGTGSNWWFEEIVFAEVILPTLK